VPPILGDVGADFFQTFFERIPVGALVWELEDDEDLGSFRLVAANQAANLTSGHDVVSLIGTTMEESFPDFLKTDVPGKLREAVRGQKPVHVGELRYGDELVPDAVFLLEAVPLPGRRVGVIYRNLKTGIRFEPVGEAPEASAEEALSRLDRQVQQAQRLESLGQLAGGVAHDFNNLLTLIASAGELMREQVDEASPFSEDLRIIEGAVERARGLSHQLLAFSRNQLLDRQPLDLNEVVEEVSAMLGRVLGENVALETELAADLGTVLADRGQMEQVLVNLAVNGRDAMGAGGRLLIETDTVELDEEYARSHRGVKPGPHAMLAVSDDGCGMTPETLGRIFEPFFTTKGHGDGTGLGLSTVFGIVKQTGGNIWVYSEVGAGTTFKIYLPVTAENEMPARPERRARGAAPARSLRVLLVEDEEMLRQLVRRMLEGFGHEVVDAPSAQAALARFDEGGGEFDLVLSDLMLPDGLGTELVDELRSRKPELLVLFTSGYTAAAAYQGEKHLPGSVFLQKPFGKAALEERIGELLESGQDPGG